ncbi:MAG: phosphate ABC transporter substrate-binding/OmpA family protein [Saprospiraceae bacterium]|nr:phosphate ABC transporter substrate-binding/OmpA family protein [Saprospiraceae bacterium]
MVAARLTSFSKFLITVLILALIYFGGNYVYNNTAFGKDLQKTVQSAKEEQSQKDNQTKTETASNAPKGDFTAAVDEDGNKVLRVQLVSWGGYAPGLYFNEGAAANLRSRFFQDYGFKVDFKLNNDLGGAVDAWIAGEYDVLVQTADAFPLYTAPDDFASLKPRAFMQVDWSRGGDAIIVKRGIKNVNELKGKTIALATPSPAQTLLISSLEAAGLSYDDVTVQRTKDNIQSAEFFKSDDVDAAVVWSPDDIFATQDVPGSKILVTTKEQSHIIADIMFASDDFIQNNKKMINEFYEGWMKGVAELEIPANRKKAGKYLAELNGVGEEDAEGMMSVVKWTGHGDNMNFFKQNRSYKGQTGTDLYTKMAQKFVETGDADKVAPNWRSVIYTGAVIAANDKLVGEQFESEKSKVFKPSAGDKTAPAISNKPVSISFETGEFTLGENAKTIIDLQFAETAKIFGNSKIRIEGNTDNVGNKASNITLSEKRAQAVADYLKSQYQMDPNRFIIIGNGPDKPVLGCEGNQTEACKAKNRRTDFSLIAD